MNFCPCLQNILKKFKGKQAQVSYEGQREFEEEEFMNPHHEDLSLSDSITPQHKFEEHRQPLPEVKAKPVVKAENLLPSYEDEKQPEAEILNIKMEMPSIQPAVKPTTIEQKVEQSIEQLIEAELLLSPSDFVKQDTLQREQIKQYPQQHVQQFVEQASFTVNLDPLDPHFALIHEKASLVPQLLRSEGQRLEVGLPNKTGLEISLIENARRSCFVLRYTLNCTYSFYLSVLRAEKTLVNLGGFVAESKTIQSYRPNLTLNTLKFKRLGGLDARDTYYVKYQNGGKRDHWELYIYEELNILSPDYKTCEVFCCKSFKQEGERELRVTEYVEVDLGVSSVSSVIPKLSAETRNFLNALNDHLERNCEQELA